MAVEQTAAKLVKLVEEISRYPLSRISTATAFDRSRPG
jgi:hypothetical protein